MNKQRLYIIGLVVVALAVGFVVESIGGEGSKLMTKGADEHPAVKELGINADQLASIDTIDKFKVVKIANGFLTATNPGKLPCGVLSKLPAGTVTVIVDLSKADIIGAASKAAHLKVGDIVNIAHIDGHHRIMIEKVFCE